MLRDKKRLQGIIAEILGDDYVKLYIAGYTYEENLRTEGATVSFDLRDAATDRTYALSGVGSGLVDALFNALINHLSKTYHTIGHFEISSFKIVGDADTGKTIRKADASATVVMRLINVRDQEFEFRHTSSSVTRSSACVVLSALEYFVNAERAYERAYEALKAARKADNPPLVDKYTRILSDLVTNTSYSDLVKDIERRHKRLK